jgi:hypothetical protein
MLAHGFKTELLAGLLRDGLASAEPFAPTGGRSRSSGCGLPRKGAGSSRNEARRRAAQRTPAIVTSGVNRAGLSRDCNFKPLVLGQFQTGVDSYDPLPMQPGSR